MAATLTGRKLLPWLQVRFLARTQTQKQQRAILQLEQLETRDLPSVSVAQFPLASGESPRAIVNGPDGNLYSADADNVYQVAPSGSISTIATFVTSDYPQAMAVGSDGKIWFTKPSENMIEQATTTGTLTAFTVPTSSSSPGGITAGPTGTLFFTENAANKIGEITTSGTFTEFAIPTSGSSPQGITYGPDGDIWFTESAVGKIAKMTTSGTFTEYSLPSSTSDPLGIAAGPDGDLWFTEQSGNKIGRITTSGTITEFSLPVSNSQPTGITAGPDSAVWFTEKNTNTIGRITTAGVLTGIPLSTGYDPNAITAGPAGTLWFTDFAGIGKVDGLSVPAVSITPIADQSNTEGDSVSLQVHASDLNSGTTLSYSAYGLPAGLTIDASTGLISGTILDGAAAAGPYAATISVTDGTYTSTANVNWTVAPSLIQFIAVPDQTSNQGSTISLQVHATDTVSGATLSFSSSGLPAGLSISSGGLISGTVSLAANNVAYAPIITVSDGTNQNSLGINWTVNSVITITQTLDQVSSEGSSVSLPIHATDSTSPAALSFSATGLPTGTSINSSTGVISGTVARGAANSGTPYTTTITVGDGTSSSSETFSWAINSAITITQTADQSSTEGQTIILPIQATDTTSPATLSFSATGLPTGTSINSSTGVISGTVADGAANSGTPYTSTITVGDGTSSTTETFSWAVASAITITQTPDQVNNEGDSVSVAVVAADATSGATVSYAAAGLPVGLAIDASTGVISGTVAGGASAWGPYAPTITVTDSNSTSTETLNWTVNPSITITQTPDQYSSEGQTVSLPIQASDSSGYTTSYFASSLPAGLSINSSTGLISGTIALGAANSGVPYSTTITVSDGIDATSIAFNWTVTSAITITAIPDQSNNEGDSVSLHVHASDATSGSTVSYTAVGLPAGLSINSSSGLISGTIALGAANSGPFTATITVSDGTSAATTNINWSVNSAITITAIPDQTNNEGDSVSLHVHASDATSGSTVAFFAAGLPQGLSMNASTGVISGAIALGAGNLGSFTVTLTVTDGTSAATTSINWTVNSAITITAIPDQSNNEGDSVSLHVHASDATSGSTLSYFAAGLPQGLSMNASTGVISGTIALGAANAGPFTAIITVSDGTSATTTSINWTVNSAITITAIPDQTNKEGDSVSLHVHASDATSGSTVSYFAAGLPQGLSINSSSGLISGTIALGAGNLGSFTATITVTDGTSAATTSINWTVNSAITITAIPDQTNNEGDSVSLHVHASDATSGSTVSYFAAGLPQGLSMNASTGVISGTIALGAANSGPFTATITVSDGTSATLTSISWSVNSAITITQPTNQVNDEGDTVSLQINATDATSGATTSFFAAGLPQGLAIDPSSGLITGTIALGAANIGYASPTVTVTDGTSSATVGFMWFVHSAITVFAFPDEKTAEGATVSVGVNASDATSGAILVYAIAGLPQGLAIDPATGVISGTVALGAANLGSYSPVVTVSDGVSAVTKDLNWTVTSAITITPIANQTSNEGATVSLTVAATDATTGATVTFAAAGLPQGLSIDSSSGVISGTVALGAANLGPYSVTILVSDGTSSSTLNVGWTVNSAISITAVAAQTNNEGDTVSLSISATDATYGATVSYSAAGLPEGLSINPSTGVISGTIAWGAANLTSTFTPIVTVSDGTSANMVSIAWTVNSAITVSALANQVNTAGDTVSLSVSASDLHTGATVSYASSNLPPGLSMNASSGVISGTIGSGVSDGSSYSVTVTVGDGTSSAKTSFTWVIGPEVQADTFYTQENADLTEDAGDGILDGAVAPDSLTLSVSLVSNVSNGSLTLNTDGSFSYDPNSNWFGTDTFVVQVSDGSVTSAPITETIEVEELLPQSNNDFRSVAIGDFNGDGNADFVAANYSTNQVFVFLGNGDGSFQAPTTISVGSGPLALAVGDFGNGVDDIAVANSTAGTVSILTNDGAGLFTVSQTLTVGSDPVALALGEFDGNGTIDLVVANKGSNNVMIFLNNGSGTFQTTPITIGVGNAPDSVAVGDLNNDTYDDLVVANSGDDDISVLLSNGDSTFASAVTYSVGTTPTAVVLADFNRDGNLDVASANGGSNNVSVLLGNGDGTLGVATNYGVGSNPVTLAVGSINDDGVMDLSVGNHGSNDETVLENDGTGAFSIAQTLPLGESPDSLGVADFANDGVLYYVTDGGVGVGQQPENKEARKELPTYVSLGVTPDGPDTFHVAPSMSEYGKALTLAREVRMDQYDSY